MRQQRFLAQSTRPLANRRQPGQPAREAGQSALTRSGRMQRGPVLGPKGERGLNAPGPCQQFAPAGSR